MHYKNLEAIIIGAGHAGLGVSYYLKQSGIKHVVFERGKVGESWRSQRWDSFVLNSPDSLNLLPGQKYEGNYPAGFSPASRFVSSLEAYVLKYQLPVAEHTQVISVERKRAAVFNVTVAEKGKINTYESRQVIICSGSQSERKVPAFAGNLNPRIFQLHAGEYRSITQLLDGAALVVGSAQSGCQVAEDLISAGKKVYLSTSMVGRVPRRYRGKDIMDWLILTKFFDARAEEISDPQMLYMKAPQLTGRGGRSISLQSLAKSGVIVLGRMKEAVDQQVFFEPDAARNVQFADAFSQKVKGMIDAFVVSNELNAPPPETDPEDMPDALSACASPIASLNLEEHNITSVIWTTGFSAGFGYIKLPVFDDFGNPVHRNGLSQVEGLYFLGLPWLRSRKSALICGVKEDAAFIAEKVVQMCEFADVRMCE